MAQFVEYTEPFWRDLSMRALKVDEAYFVLKSLFNRTVYLYTLSHECFTCPYSRVKALPPTTTPGVDDAAAADPHALKLNVAFPLKFQLYDYDVGAYAFPNETAEALCSFERDNLLEFGVYNLTVHGDGSCRLLTDKPGFVAEQSIFSVLLLLVALVVVAKTSCDAWRRYRHEQDDTATGEGSDASAAAAGDPPAPTSPPINTRRRMQSLDAFRGFAIVLMIFVNSGGGNYWWMEHASWNGLHVADVVFPSFLWIMGVCIPISIKSQIGRGATKCQIYRRICWRGVKLFLIGLCLNSINGPQLEQLRVMGVLQRFGIAFVVCGVVHTFCTTQLSAPQMPEAGWKRSVHDLIVFRGEFLAIVTLVAVHLGIAFGLDVPDCPRGYLGPGGKHEYAAHPNCIGGAAGYIDTQLLGTAHIYQHPTARYIYDSQPFDPEGVFGCLLTVVQVLLGVLAGVTLLTYSDWRQRLSRWLYWSLALALLGGALCAFSKEDGPIPINKNLWSLSFVCITSALAFFVLAGLYLVIDVQAYWKGSPFVESGLNSIIMYVGHTIMHRMLPWHWKIGAMNTHFVLMLEALWNTILWMGIALYLDAKRFYYSL